ncbi:hypothetical protein L2E82_12196 [Cichorium intybus]|uniref:Uncharacterized protein n=1 Tax=Cichorium intybus TaxID=13427 RepID=A0ACB9GFJ8_CICIN|nr:hypothetical protein L2E82_12196 [Cichorium intybus]
MAGQATPTFLATQISSGSSSFCRSSCLRNSTSEMVNDKEESSFQLEVRIMEDEETAEQLLFIVRRQSAVALPFILYEGRTQTVRPVDEHKGQSVYKSKHICKSKSLSKSEDEQHLQIRIDEPKSRNWS